MQMQRKSEGADAQVVQNAAKTLYANIRFASVDHPIKVVMLTSSVPNEGKTTVAYNLAVAVASGGKRVLLVECDMRRRSIADSIGERARYGIYSVLSHQVELSQAVAATQQANLFFLDAEPNIPNPADIISSHRFRDLIATMKASYDFVIVDTPPVGTFVDAAILSTLVDGTAIVVRDSFTHRNELLAAYEQLKKADANIIGVILNGTESDTSEYYYSYYNKDGKRVRKGHDHVEEGPSLPTQRSATPQAASVPTQRSASGSVPAQRAAGVAPAQGSLQSGSRFSR